MANNHVYDQGPDGLMETVRRVQAAGMEAVGAGPTCRVAHAPVIRDVSGVRVAFLAVADLVNIDENGASDGPCAFFAGPVCTADCGPDRDAIHFSLDTERLLAAVEVARSRADFVVMSFHWGNEYRTEPLPEYPVLAQTLVDAGVDVLLGHHPHVLQPVRWLDTTDGRRALVAFSLGNFVSNMAADFSLEGSSIRRGNTRDGALLRVILTRTGEERHIESAEVVPLWTQNNHNHRAETHRVVVRTHDSLLREGGHDALVASRREVISTIVGASFLKSP